MRFFLFLLRKETQNLKLLFTIIYENIPLKQKTKEKLVRNTKTNTKYY